MKSAIFLIGFIFLAQINFDSTSTTIVKGIVVDESGSPLIGANVLVKGTTIGTITDIDGTFQIVVEVESKLI